MAYLSTTPRTLSVKTGLSSLVLCDLVHRMLLAFLAFAEGPLGLRNVHLHTASDIDWMTKYVRQMRAFD